MRWRRAPDLFDAPAEALEWVQLVQCARWAGVAPWDLARQPIAWLDAILVAMLLDSSETKALKEKE
ncbi:MAG: hypothetical protein WHV44_00230 [Anaerolineales bacterium]